MWLWKLLLDERGEDPGQGDSPGASGEGQSSSGGDPNDQAGDGSPEEPEGGVAKVVTPKYGEFGDTPTVDDVFGAYGKTKTDFDNFRKKAGLTEQNLGKLRQTLSTAGIEISEDGQLRLKEGAGKPKTRFTDSHKSLFDQKVLEGIQFLMDDMLDNRLNSFSQRTRQEQAFSQTLSRSIDKMYQLYPSIQKEIGGKTNPEFNQAFFDRADEILQERYRNLPNGDLIAAHEAAIELNISPITIEKAKREGFDKGVGAKKILGPARPGGQKTSPAGKLSKEEYLKLSPEEKSEYDKKSILT